MAVSNVAAGGKPAKPDAEVLMGDRTWQPGIVHSVSADGKRALIEWNGITAWFDRGRGPGYPNEWRWLASSEKRDGRA